MSTTEEQKILIELETMPFIVGPTENGQERKQEHFDDLRMKDVGGRVQNGHSDTKSVMSTVISRKNGISWVGESWNKWRGIDGFLGLNILKN